MSYFSKELWDALTRPFKIQEDGECHKWVNVLGSLLDDARTSVLDIRRQWAIKNATGWTLDLRGLERDLPRWPKENDEAYRKRILDAFRFYAMGGTLPGMQWTLAHIGYTDNVTITERSGPTWSHFLLAFQFPLGKTMGRPEWDALEFAVWRMKPAHTMPLYLFTFIPGPQTLKLIMSPQIEVDSRVDHAFWPKRRKVYRLDGTAPLHGSITLGAGWEQFIDREAENNPLHRVDMQAEVKPVHTFTNPVCHLDGTSHLQGALYLNGLRPTNSPWANHLTYIERMENGVSTGMEVLS